MSTKSKLDIISEILTEAELNDNGLCKECAYIDEECGCLAGLIRAKMTEHADAPFFPSDDVCIQMYAEHFGLDALGDKYFEDLCDFTDNWVDQNFDGDTCDCCDHEPKPDPKLN